MKQASVIRFFGIIKRKEAPYFLSILVKKIFHVVQRLGGSSQTGILI